MTEGNISFHLQNDVRELDKLSRIMTRFTEICRLPKRIGLELNLVMEELFTNLIRYGYADAHLHLIRVAVSYENAAVTLCIQDDGMPFNLLQTPAPDTKCGLEERTVGGLGIHLIKEFMDEIVYRRIGNQNILMMRKNVC
jgi:anti-sigma regulatory factor (Ser/Thr protein kinase)